MLSLPEPGATAGDVLRPMCSAFPTSRWKRCTTISSGCVLTQAEIDAIRADPSAQDTLRRAAGRMLRFYRNTRWWLTPYDHNHLRITRIIHSLRILTGPEEAQRFHKAVLALNDAAGSPVNARSLEYWADAAGT